MEDKIAKLEAATAQAEKDMQQHLALLSDATERVRVAKALLKSMPKEEQEKIQVTDTKLPELLDLLATASESYETSQQRYETNKWYLDMLKQKMGDPTDGDDSANKKDESLAA